MNENIKNDLYRRNGLPYKLSLLVKELMVPQFRFVFIKRKCEYWRGKNKMFFAFWRMLYGHYKITYNMDIPAKVRIGKGFRIGHIGGIVFNPDVIIGDNVDIYNGVLLGATFRGRSKGTPTIGNRVWIGTNATIVGNITIGDDCLIAPNTAVNTNVPPHSIVHGNPMQIKHREEATKDYIINIVK